MSSKSGSSKWLETLPLAADLEMFSPVASSEGTRPLFETLVLQTYSESDCNVTHVVSFHRPTIDYRCANIDFNDVLENFPN